ncbi:MAG: adenine phosphoribosyltransferase [Bacillota bacterium]|nr:adenine phosphoribosyltransferase [Bacillota bacterium]
MNWVEKIRNIPDYPAPGILFRDLTPLWKDPEIFRYLVETMAGKAAPWSPDMVLGIEARGFIFGAPLALALGVGFVPARKEGHLPHDTYRVEYQLEYGLASLEIHRDALEPGMRVLIVDDLLATGGTGLAACRLVEEGGGEVAGLLFAVELEGLAGRQSLTPYRVESLARLP